MSSKKGLQSVRPRYRQAFLSGYEHLTQPKNENGDRKKDLEDAEITEPPRGKRSYNLSLQVIIEQAGNDSGEYLYKIRLNDNANLLVAPYSITGKKDIGPASSLPKETGQGVYVLPLVYGIHEGGNGTLSHPNGRDILQETSHIYGWLLGQLDRAIKCTVLKPENEATNDDTGQRKEGTPTPKSMGTNKKARRGKKVLPKVLPETPSEKAAELVEDDWEILVGRQEDAQARHELLGSRTYDGSSIADALSDGQAPDIGF